MLQNVNDYTCFSVDTRARQLWYDLGRHIYGTMKIDIQTHVRNINFPSRELESNLMSYTQEFFPFPEVFVLSKWDNCYHVIPNCGKKRDGSLKTIQVHPLTPNILFDTDLSCILFATEIDNKLCYNNSKQYGSLLQYRQHELESLLKE